VGEPQAHKAPPLMTDAFGWFIFLSSAMIRRREAVIMGVLPGVFFLVVAICLKHTTAQLEVDFQIPFKPQTSMTIVHMCIQGALMTEAGATNVQFEDPREYFRIDSSENEVRHHRKPAASFRCVQTPNFYLCRVCEGDDQRRKLLRASEVTSITLKGLESSIADCLKSNKALNGAVSVSLVDHRKV
jgi:hypothetical protein